MKEEQILTEALQIKDSAERAAFLDRTCAGQPALRERIEQDLAHASRGGHDSETAAADQPAPANVEDVLAFLAPSSLEGAMGRLGHYHVLEVIGRGGMGLVLKAFDEKLERVVAVKVMAPALASNATARRRFVREARAAAALSHENIVGIHAVEDDGPIPYLILQFVAGQSLQTRIKEGPLGVSEIVQIGVQLARGLEEAHKHGLVHRDIKPANILLEADSGRVKITDFGLARALDDGSLTQSGMVAGTPMYMSPEQAEGKKLDHRTDLFSLGSVLYAMASGRAAFAANSAVAILRRVCDEEPRSVHELNPAIPRWLETIIHKLLAKNPADRYQSAGEVAAVLSEHLGRPTPPEQKGQPRNAVASRNVLLAALGGMLLFVVLGGLLLLGSMGALIVFLVSKPSERVARNDDNQPNVTPKPLPQIPLQSIQVNRFLARDGMHNGCIPRCYSPDGKLLVTVGQDDKVRVWETASGALREELACPGDINHGPTFSHNGGLLAIYGGDNGDHDITLWDTRTWQVRGKLQGHKDRVWCVAFRPDDRILASAGQDNTMRLWNVADLKEIDRLDAFPLGVDQVLFDPGGKRLLTRNAVAESKQIGSIWTPDAAVRLWDIDPASGRYKQQLRQWPIPESRNASVVFTPDGSHLVIGRQTVTEPHQVVMHVDKDQPARELRDNPPLLAWPVGFLDDGKILLTINRPADGSELPRDAYHVKFWRLDTGKLEREFMVPDVGAFQNAVLSLDRRTLVIGGRATQRLLYFDLATGKQLFPAGP